MLYSQQEHVLKGKGAQLELDHLVSGPSWIE